MVLVLLLKISKGFDNSTTIISSSRTYVPVVIEDAYGDVVLGDGDNYGDVLLLLDLQLVHLIESPTLLTRWRRYIFWKIYLYSIV